MDVTVKALYGQWIDTKEDNFTSQNQFCVVAGCLSENYYYGIDSLCIPVNSHGFSVSLMILAMKSQSHADYVISHAFQLKQNLRK